MLSHSGWSADVGAAIRPPSLGLVVATQTDVAQQASVNDFKVRGGDPSLPKAYSKEVSYTSATPKRNVTNLRRRCVTSAEELEARKSISSTCTFGGSSSSLGDVPMPEQQVGRKVISNFDDSDCSLAEESDGL